MTTRDGKAIRFEYYLGRLNKIFDTRERMTLFEYNNNGFLSKIVYPDNQAAVASSVSSVHSATPFSNP